MAEHTLEQPVHRRTLVFLAKAGVTAVVIWWLLQMVDISQTLSLLRSVEAGPLIIAVLVLLVQAGVGALRWRSIVLIQGGRIGVARAMHLFFLGTFFNQTLSTTVGGDAVRVWRLKATGVSLGRATGGVVLERLAGLVTLGILAAAALPLVQGPALVALSLLVGASVVSATLVAVGSRLGSPGSPWRRILDDAHAALLSRQGLGVLCLSVLIHLGGRWLCGPCPGVWDWMCLCCRAWCWSRRRCWWRPCRFRWAVGACAKACWLPLSG